MAVDLERGQGPLPDSEITSLNANSVIECCLILSWWSPLTLGSPAPRENDAAFALLRRGKAAASHQAAKPNSTWRTTLEAKRYAH
jgi:hypothetical protein